MLHNARLRDCIQECLDCYQICLETASGHCLEQGGDHVEPEHFRLMLDCAEICRTSADFMIRRSNAHRQTCDLCAQICERCAIECESFDDRRMQACAEACRRCAAECAEMVSAMA
jgi:hypothetical protein